MELFKAPFFLNLWYNFSGDAMENVYLIYGEEKYLIDEKIKEISNKYIINNEDNNFIKYDLCETSIEDLLEDASMQSLFSNVKVVIGINAFFLTSSNSKINIDHNLEKLIKYINSPNPSSILILTVNNSLDERKKIVKELKNKATVYEYKKTDYNTLFAFIKNKLSKSGYQFHDETIKLFISRVGYDLIRVDNEIDKLMLYRYYEKEIFDEDVLDLVPKTLEENIFDLIDAVVSKDKEKIFMIYDYLLNQGEEAIKIIVLLANQFRLIYQIKILAEKGYDEKDIASSLKVHPYRVKLAYLKGKTFKEKILLNYLNELAELDIAIKTGDIDKEMGLELFLLKM